MFFDGLQLSNDIACQERDTKHENYINGLQPYAFNGKDVSLITTSDPNGCINYWDVSKL